MNWEWQQLWERIFKSLGYKHAAYNYNLFHTYENTSKGYSTVFPSI